MVEVNKLLGMAIWYAETMKFAVFPCHSIVGDGQCTCGNKNCSSRGKHPRTQDGFKSATKDRTQLELWWNKWPNANVAIATGSISGIVVLDCDPKNDGDESYRKLCKERGGIPTTPQVVSGSLGTHDYFRLHPECKVGRRIGVLPGLDLLGDNGYVIAPPSLHASGRLYHWEVEHDISEVPLADAPAWLIELGVEDSTPGAQPKPASILPAKIEPGGRNNALISYLGTLRRRGAEEAELQACGEAFCSHRMDLPLTTDEIVNAVKSIVKYKPSSGVPSKIGDMKREDLAILGLKKLDEIADLPRDEVLPALADQDVVRMLVAARAENKPAYLAGMDRIRPNSLSAKVQQVVRDAVAKMKAAQKPAQQAQAQAQHSHQKTGDRRPTVDLSSSDLQEAVTSSIHSMLAVNKPPEQRALYRRGGAIVRISHESGVGARATVMTEWSMREALADGVRYVRRGGEDGQSLFSVYPPRDVVTSVLVSPDATFPKLSAIYSHPVIVPDNDGVLPLASSSYHVNSGTLALCGNECAGLPVTATKDSAMRAIKWILDEVLVDFPFAGESERATTLALALLPYIRPLIAGVTPLHLMEASTPGSGKGYLVYACLFPALGKSGLSFTTLPYDEDEKRKKITAAAAGARESIVFDNVSGIVDSDALASVLTTPMWTDRRLGQSEHVEYELSTIWVMTANNVSLSSDIARRAIRARIVPDVEKPWVGRQFKHANLRGWMDDHRADVLRAYWTCVVGWATAKCPTVKEPLMGSFEAWSQIMGGLLSWLEVPGFLANRDALLEESGRDADESLNRLLDAWEMTHAGGVEITTNDIMPIAQRVDVPMKGDSDTAKKRSLAHYLRRNQDRVVGGRRLLCRHERSCVYWKLVKVAETVVK